MKTSPLQLEHYFLAESHCKASSEPSDEAKDVLQPAKAEQFSTEIRMFQGQSEPNSYQIQLVIKTKEEFEPELPYELMVHLIGYFRVSPDFTHDQLEHLIQVNGASVLYSAARDFILTLTSRGPWGPMMLPTINFRISHKVAETVADKQD